MLTAVSQDVVVPGVRMSAHLAAGGRGFVLWVLFRPLVHAIGWVAAMVLIVAVGLVSTAVRIQRRR